MISYEQNVIVFGTQRAQHVRWTCGLSRPERSGDRRFNLRFTSVGGKQSPLDSAPRKWPEVIETVEEAESAEVIPEDINTESTGLCAEEVAEIVEAILEPDVSTTLEEVVEGDEDPEDPEETCGADALRAALNAAAPRLAKMSRKQRRKAAADIAARVQKTRRKGANRGYDRVTKPRPAKDSGNAYNALGKRIMAARNANYHK